MKSPRIAIIILHYKNLADTRACLRSLRKIDYPLSNLPLTKGETQRGFSVIVVNNDASDHAQTFQDEFGDFIEIIQNENNLGFAEGNNVGIRQALKDQKTNAILLLNNDTVVEPDFLSAIVKSDAGMVAPRMMRYDERNKIDNLGIVLMSSGLAFNRSDENQKLFCPCGACALYSRKLLETIVIARRGTSRSNDSYYFDPSYFAYCGDLDLGWRARNAGFKPAYAKDAIVFHKGSASTNKLSDFAVYHTYRNLLWTQFKNFPAPLLLWQSPWLGVGWFFIISLYFFKGRPSIIFPPLLY